MNGASRQRALLAWEAGSGRGHVVTLGTVARALPASFTLDAALRRMDHARELADACELVFQGPGLDYAPLPARGAQGPATSTWGEYLADIGFASPALVATRVKWWQRLMRERAYELVVADYAPCAMIAARSLGIKVLAVGTGFGLPPAQLATFPAFAASGDVEAFDEEALVAPLNRALAPLGVQTLMHLPAIYACDETIVRTPPLFDPYARWREVPAIALHPLPRPSAQSCERRSIFLYLSSGPKDGGGLVEACVASGLPVLAYVPALSDEGRALLSASGAHVSPAPVSPERIARGCALLVHHGQPGMALMGLACRTPQAVLPLHAEQRFHAEALEGLGAGARLHRGMRHAWPSLLVGMANDAHVRARAVATPQVLEEFLNADHGAALRERIGIMLDR